ncbi:MAG: hypothetical protein G01um10147_985 [Microgenomates group bacterium Gr01-1014_7]|nr:MAG: hypothetical protein G01um10147_985 [Microgenomates group bacterium Gr01-1014_7]
MPERKFVPVKFPLYLSESREVEVSGNLKVVQPFVEQWRIFDIPSQTFFLPTSKFSKQVHLGLRIECEEDIISGGDPNRPDPIRLYRALQFLNRIDRFPIEHDQKVVLGPNLHLDLADAYDAAGHSYPLAHHHYVTNRIKAFVGDETFQEVLRMVPPNLMAVIENLRHQKVTIDGETLVREVSRGTLDSNTLYEKIISETKRRKWQDRKFRERFRRNSLAFLTA